MLFVCLFVFLIGFCPRIRRQGSQDPGVLGSGTITAYIETMIISFGIYSYFDPSSTTLLWVNTYVCNTYVYIYIIYTVYAVCKDAAASPTDGLQLNRSESEELSRGALPRFPGA